MQELERFIEAQDDVWPDVERELRAGEKRTHWMWFVFPQLAGLGSSEMARHYAIADLTEARAYRDHLVLGPRLHDAAGWLLAHPDRSADEMLGGIDAQKLRSCATLFEAAGEDDRMPALLDTFFNGERDPRTLALLEQD